jgi:4-hydroxybenzoyl-CoA thioesterase/acyl-CoA thioester hydrolase
MPETFQTRRRVEWRDTDAAGIAHISCFMDYMEEAEHALLRHVGLSVSFRDEQGPISLPRVAVRCEYHSSVRFEDELEIDVRVERLGEKSVTYAFGFTCQGRAVANGSITAVCCRLAPDTPPRSIPLPASFVAALRDYVAPPG